MLIASCNKPEESSDARSYQKNALIVEFAKGVSKKQIYMLVKKLNIGNIKFLTRDSRGGYVILVKSPELFRLKNQIKSESIVKSVEFNYKRKTLRKK